jgi:hypothetical protein
MRRGPKPAGLISTVVKIPGGMRAALLAAAAKGERNLSEEVRYRLQHSLNDPEDERTRAVMWLLQSVLRSTMGRKMSIWLDDPYAFDQAVIAITMTLEMIRAPGAIEAPAAGAGLHGAFAARATMADVQKAPAIAPANASAHRREMVLIRQVIGDLADRAMIHGKTAEQLRADEPARLELVALRRNEANAVRGKGVPLTNGEERRMKALIKRLVTVPRADG